MQITFTLRPFESSDLEQVLHINRVCLPENYTSLFFLDLHKQFPETFLVAEDNGTVIGYIMCRIETGLPNFKIIGIMKKGHVISIAVLPQHQRQGVGLALIQEAMNAMLRYKAKECVLEVRASNTAAVNLYKKLGFEIKRTLHRYYVDGEDAYLMAKKLSFKH